MSNLSRAYQRAVTPPSNHIVKSLSEGLALHQQGLIADALEVYESILQTDPRHYDALQLSGTGLLQLGQAAAACDRLAAAIEVNDQDPGTWSNWLAALNEAGRTPEAIAAGERATARFPQVANIAFNLGNAYRTEDRWTEAAGAYQSAREAAPNMAAAWGNEADARLELGERELAQGCAERALALQPDLHSARVTLGLIYDHGRRADLAIAEYERVLEDVPTYVKAHVNLANSLRDIGEIDRSEDHAAIACGLSQDTPEAWIARGHALLGQGYADDAAMSFEIATELNPHEPIYLSNYLMARQYAPDTSAEDLKLLAEGMDGLYGSLYKPPTPGPVRRIGFVSGDLGWHPVGRFLLPVLKALAGRAEVFLYPTNERDEPHGQALRELAMASRGLHRVPTAEAVRMIQADEIDLLVDLSGHTADHRLDIFARRAAPMQATYLGYSGTTGIANMDAILSDELQVPAEEITNFSERPWYIPGGSFTWPDLEIPAEAKISQSHEGVVFASFNNAAKLSEPCLFQWARLVSSIPGASLLLKNPGFRSERARAHVLEILVMGGMDPRLVRFETLLPTREHFLLYQEVDIALDPWPYGGATTTVETLACGVPVLTLAGSRYTQRMSASILTTAGFTEGITYTLDEWLERGRAWAEDAAWRMTLRQTLPEQTESALRQQALRIANTLLQGPPLG